MNLNFIEDSLQRLNLGTVTRACISIVCGHDALVRAVSPLYLDEPTDTVTARSHESNMHSIALSTWLKPAFEC